MGHRYVLPDYSHGKARKEPNLGLGGTHTPTSNRLRPDGCKLHCALEKEEGGDGSETDGLGWPAGRNKIRCVYLVKKFGFWYCSTFRCYLINNV